MLRQGAARRRRKVGSGESQEPAHVTYSLSKQRTILACNTGDVMSQRQTILGCNTGDVMSQRQTILGYNTGDVMFAQWQTVLGYNTEDVMFAQLTSANSRSIRMS